MKTRVKDTPRMTVAIAGTYHGIVANAPLHKSRQRTRNKNKGKAKTYVQPKKKIPTTRKGPAYIAPQSRSSGGG